MSWELEDSWRNILSGELEKSYYTDLQLFVNAEYEKDTCYPALGAVFNAFNLCSLDNLKVVLIGQDPYINPGQAHGLCFSVTNEKLPPSLKNIYKELYSDLGTVKSNLGDLTAWAQQGVLMINSVLTVKAGESNSHAGKGWEVFTDQVISEINLRKKNVVYILWGSYAQKKAKNVDQENNLLLKSVHPSPLSAYRGFFGCKHFSQTNTYLESHGIENINW